MSEEIESTQDMIYGFAASPGFGTPGGGICLMARNSGLFRSDDGGQTWTDALKSLNLPTSIATTCVGLPADFEHDHTILAGMAGGVILSQNSGIN